MPISITSNKTPNKDIQKLGNEEVFLDISNQAINLTGLGLEEIGSSLDENRQARICTQLFPTVLERFLLKYYWDFSLEVSDLPLEKTEDLSLLSSSYMFLDFYRLPIDFIKLREVIVPRDPLIVYTISKPYIEIQSSIIYGKEFCRIEYQRIPPYDKFPERAKNIMAIDLCSSLLKVFTGDIQQASFKSQEYLRSVREYIYDSQSNRSNENLFARRSKIFFGNRSIYDRTNKFR